MKPIKTLFEDIDKGLDAGNEHGFRQDAIWQQLDNELRPRRKTYWLWLAASLVPVMIAGWLWWPQKQNVDLAKTKQRIDLITKKSDKMSIHKNDFEVVSQTSTKHIQQRKERSILLNPMPSFPQKQLENSENLVQIKEGITPKIPLAETVIALAIDTIMPKKTMETFPKISQTKAISKVKFKVVHINETQNGGSENLAIEPKQPSFWTSIQAKMNESSQEGNVTSYLKKIKQITKNQEVTNN